MTHAMLGPTQLSTYRPQKLQASRGKIPEIIRLRELSRFEEELKTELTRITNRLWQQLPRYYPQMLTVSPPADDRFVWDLLSKVRLCP